MASKKSYLSPFAPEKFPNLPILSGVSSATAAAGIKYLGRTDVLLISLPKETVVAGIFTKSKCPSAPVDWCRSLIKGGKARGIVVNSGNANAFTGEKGKIAVEKTAIIAAKALGCNPNEIAIASTGVIGEPLDASKFEGVLENCAQNLKEDAWLEAASAIMTTDTFPKGASIIAKIGDIEVKIVGIAKGAGMIAPDMATMLSFVFTDAAIPHNILQDCLANGGECSFNSITVDSDTSTSDTLLLFATGDAQKRGQREIKSKNDPELDDFRNKLNELLLDLALQVVKDGEGARKLIKVRVEGAESDISAKKIALSIANSPLVKTAIAGEDANWGRVVMAVGKAGEPANRDKLSIFFGQYCLAENGVRASSYDEVEISSYMKNPEIEIIAKIDIGSGKATVYTCDLTKDYVEINGDYRS